MKSNIGRRTLSLLAGVLVLGLVIPRVGLAQAAQNPPNQSSTATQDTTQAKKSKKSKKAADAGATSSTPASTPASSSAPSTSQPAASSSAPAASSSTASTKSASGSKASSVQAQTPPSPGMVWVNTNTKVYHKAGSQYYGKTKQGKWMTEQDAIKAGYRAASNE